MNIIKNTIAAASVLVCCMGNEMPAKAYNLHCMNIGSTMRTCNDSNGNSGTYQRFGNFENININGGGRNVSCYRQYIGNQVYINCN